MCEPVSVASKNSRKLDQIEEEESSKRQCTKPSKTDLPPKEDVLAQIETTWVQQLKLKFEELKPYGVIITAPSNEDQKMMVSELDPQLLKELCWHTGFVILRDFKSLEREDMIKTAKTLGEILEWPDYGAILDVKVEKDAKSFIMAPEAVPFHFDGMFFKVPSFQFFQCLIAPAPDAGGDTLFCDGIKLLEDAPKEKLELWKKTTIGYFTKKTHFGGHTVHFGLVDKHPHTGKETLRYNEPWDAPTQQVFTSCDTLNEEELKELHSDLVKRIYDPKYCFFQKWKNGDFVLTDNHAQLHGRSAFSADTPRHLIRIHIM